jgi:hypothetical protein
MIVKIGNHYVLNENVNVAVNNLPQRVGNGFNHNPIVNIPQFPLHINSANDVVFIFTHGDVNVVGGYYVNQLSALFENPRGKTFVLISCKAGVGNRIEGSFAEEFAKTNKCRVFAPMGCSVFSNNGIAVIPESEVEKYSRLQEQFEQVGQNAQVLNKMFNACSVDDKCFTIEWNELNNYEQLLGYGFLEIDARD